MEHTFKKPKKTEFPAAPTMVKERQCCSESV